jgi:nitrogen fixation protein
MGIREETYFEGGPHTGDLIFNILLGFTVICLPLTVGSIVRALWLRYRFTDRRISVTGGWMGRDRSDVVYTDIVKVVKIPRGLGLWGDMVLTLKNGSRIELKALPRFRELYDYIDEKVKAKTGKSIAA